MSGTWSQAAIKEARDQILLDHADGHRLGAVSSNLGMRRPEYGFGDPEWRGFVRMLALRRKLTTDAFRRLLEACVGPRFGRAGDLRNAATAGDRILAVIDASLYTPAGIVLLDPGMATEEEARYIWRDLAANELVLARAIAFPHLVWNTKIGATEGGAGRLRATAAVGATTLSLIDTSSFPITTPYPVLVGWGTEEEEVVIVSANTVGTATLTVSATLREHDGPRSRYVTRFLSAAASAGRTFLQFAADATREMPASGFVRINKGGGNEATVEYDGNDPDSGILSLEAPLAAAHTAGEPVDLVRPGVEVRTCSVLQEGIHWQILDTDPRNLRIYVPDAAERLEIRDATWLHDRANLGIFTTLASAAASGDTELEVGAATNFPDEAAMLLVGGATTAFYLARDEDAVPPRLVLSRALGVSYPPGTVVALLEVPYAGTDLEDGNLRDANGAVQQNRFPGKYLYAAGETAPGRIATTLADRIAGPTRVVADQVPGRTALEVRDASLYSGLDAFRIGRASGFEETAALSSVVLARNANGSGNTINVLAPVGATTLDCTNTNSFPVSSSGAIPAGYRIVVDEGGPDEEILIVAQNDTAADDFTLVVPSTIAHDPGETVRLLADVMVFTAALTEPHAGPRASPSRDGATVEPLIAEIVLADGSSFPTADGTILLNHGKGRLDARARIASIVAGNIHELESTDGFPAGDFPYLVIVGAGTALEEVADVTANDTALDRLTYSLATVNTHVAGEYVAFHAGTPEEIEYASRSLDTLTLDPPVALVSGHSEGETATLSAGESLPATDADDYQAFLPPDRAACVKLMFDLVRAAGVRATVVTER